MSQGQNRLDLSALPPEMRQKVMQKLAQLPPDQREKLMQRGGQLVQMLGGQGGSQPPPLPAGAKAAAGQAGQALQHAAKAAQQAMQQRATQRRAPSGHYNETIRPGDGLGGGRWVVMVLMFAVFAYFIWF